LDCHRYDEYANSVSLSIIENRKGRTRRFRQQVYAGIMQHNQSIATICNLEENLDCNKQKLQVPAITTTSDHRHPYLICLFWQTHHGVCAGEARLSSMLYGPQPKNRRDHPF